MGLPREGRFPPGPADPVNDFLAVSEMATESVYESLVQVTHRFFYFLDEFRYDDLVALMTEDAVWHRQGKVLRGREQVLAALAERPRTQRIRHVITNAFVDEDGAGSARLTAYLTAYRADEGVSRPPPQTIDGPFRLLLVDARFVRTEAGWRMAEQRGTPEFEFRPR